MTRSRNANRRDPRPRRDRYTVTLEFEVSATSGGNALERANEKLDNDTHDGELSVSKKY